MTALAAIVRFLLSLLACPAIEASVEPVAPAEPRPRCACGDALADHADNGWCRLCGCSYPEPVGFEPAELVA